MITIIYQKDGAKQKAFCQENRLAKTKKALKESEYTIIEERLATEEELKELTILTTKPENKIGRAQINALTSRVESRFYNKRG